MLFHHSYALDYREIFGGRYKKAEKKLTEILPLIQQYANEYGEDEYLVAAVIFPEIMRYNSVYNAVETGSLMGLYSRFGADYANFSIGLLQMKPSFALSIEKELKKHKTENWVKKLEFDKLNVDDTYDARRARVTRLTKPEWQIRYFIGMLKCLQLKYNTAGLNANNRVQFVASAYNCGWDKGAATIRKYINKKYYRLGNWDTGDKYAFADIALFHYKETASLK